MNIAVISNFDKDITPTSGGGSETFTFDLANGLAEKDHQVTVFGIGHNHFDHKNITYQPIHDKNIKEFVTSNQLLDSLHTGRKDFETQVRFSTVAKAVKELLTNTSFDIIHDNSTSALFNILSSLTNTPIISTAHTNYDSPSILIPYFLGQLPQPNQHFVSISNYQNKFLEANNIAIQPFSTIYNGTNTKLYQPSLTTKKDSYGLWVGRISAKHNKGIKEALALTNQLKSKLTVITTIDDQEYFEHEIKPLLSSEIEFIDYPIDMQRKIEIYQNASYLLYPLQWEEPFGLVFIEAMACGVPVIALARGATPEIIADGVTGFLINPSDGDHRGTWQIESTGMYGLEQAVRTLQSFSDDAYKDMRAASSDHVEKHFSRDIMVENYINVYEKILNH